MSILKQIDENIVNLNKQISWAYYARMFVLEHLEAFDLLPDATISANHIDFDYLNHDQVLQVIKAFPGRWKKEPVGEKINYSNTLRNISKTSGYEEIIIRCYNGEPPPNCKIEYEEVLVPAHTERRAKMVCFDRQNLNGNAPAQIDNKEEVPDAIEVF